MAEGGIYHVVLRRCCLNFSTLSMDELWMSRGANIAAVAKLALFALLAFCGCQEATPPNPAAEKKVALTGPIAPGVGAVGLHLGMGVEAVKHKKMPSEVIMSEIDLGERWLQYYHDGISISCDKNDCVAGIHYMFFPKQYRPYRGATKEGIGADSAIRDVIYTYGQPTTISNVIESKPSEWPGARRVLLAYAEKGILFQFINDRLSQIAVFSPQEDYDPFWWSDTGDVSKHRNIKVPDDARKFDRDFSKKRSEKKG